MINGDNVMEAKTNQSSNTLIFEDGILGFEDIKRYDLKFSKDIWPFIHLQSQCGRVSFIVCDPVYFYPGYKPPLNNRVCRELKVKCKEHLRCLAIATIPGNIKDITINLKSPIVLNIENNHAKQYVTDEPDYPIKFRIIKDNELV
ncbi:MAG: flagellar assembly protein FliW [Oscillospiraceae bacterium]|nr:flagellar assembly protein FliW [Oscillospiraceae bacterium]